MECLHNTSFLGIQFLFCHRWEKKTKHQQPPTCIIFMYMIISHQLQYTNLYTTITQIIQVLNVFNFFFYYIFFPLFFFFNLTCMLKKSQSWGLSSAAEPMAVLMPLSLLGYQSNTSSANTNCWGEPLPLLQPGSRSLTSDLSTAGFDRQQNMAHNPNLYGE